MLNSRDNIKDKCNLRMQLIYRTLAIKQKKYNELARYQTIVMVVFSQFVVVVFYIESNQA